MSFNTWAISQAIGSIGALFVIVAYGGLTLRWITNKKTYFATNLIGALLLTVSLYYSPNIGSIIIEMFWIAISVLGLMSKSSKNDPYK